MIDITDFMLQRAVPPYPATGKAAFIEAVRVAVATHPAIGAAGAEVAMSEAAGREAFAGFLPTISGSGDSGYRSYGSTATTQSSVQKYRTPNVGLTLRQLVYDFGATSRLHDSALARQKQAEAELAAARGDYAMRAINAYVDVLRMRSHMTLAEQNKASRKAMVDRMAERARSGGGSEADVTRAEGRYLEAVANASSTANRLSAAESTFSEIFGRAPPPLLPPPFDPPVAGADKSLPDLLASYAPARSRAAARNAAEAEAEAVKSRALPRLDLQLSHTRREWNDVSVGKPGSDTSAVLSMRYDFYTGGADAARSEQSAWKAGRAALDYDLTRRQFEHALSQARADIVSSVDIVDARIKAARASIRSMAAVNEQFEFNRGSLIDAMKTQEELYLAGKDLIDALAERFLARFRLLYFTSQLDGVFGLEEAVNVAATRARSAPSGPLGGGAAR